MSAAISFDSVTRRYRGPVVAVNAVSLSVPAGSLVAILGRSGSGKTTLLRMAAGLEPVDAGRIEVQGRTVADASSGAFLAPEKRKVGLLFQEHALFPHLSVARNIAFGLRALDEGQRRSRVQELLERIDLTGHEDRNPHTLSGGQQQRVALARALATEPELLLMDEPFSSLDPTLGRQLRDEVRAILRNAGTAAMLVTHDAEHAMHFADRIALMDAGRLLQVGSPREVFEQPVSPTAARLTGPCNVIDAHLGPNGFETTFGTFPRGSRHATLADGPCQIGLRPHDLVATPTASSGRPTITTACFVGSHWDLEATSPTADRLVLRSHRPLDEGTPVTLSCDPAHLLHFPHPVPGTG